MELIQKIVSSSNLAYCTTCGKCLSVCPSYREFMNELHSPRGRLALVHAFIEGELSGGRQLFYAISHCLLCGACNTACPAGIKPADAVMWIRGHERFRRETSRFERVLLRTIVRHQETLRLLSSPLRLYQRLRLSEILRRFGLQHALPYAIANLESLLPEYQGEPFLRRVPDVVPARNAAKGTITFFAGCAMNLLFPRASRATVEVAAALGWNVKIPKNIFCCGAPHLHEGDLDTARQLALHNMELLLTNDPELVVSDCASCSAMFRAYPELFGEDSSEYEKALEFAQRVKDVTEFFNAEIHDGSVLRSYGNVRVAYDVPCELYHVLGITDAPRALLAKLPGVRIVEIPETDWCCGSAGAYGLKHPDVAHRILHRKMDNIVEASPDYVLSSNPGCLLHIAKGLRERDARIRLMHLSEFVQLGIK